MKISKMIFILFGAVLVGFIMYSLFTKRNYSLSEEDYYNGTKIFTNLMSFKQSCGYYPKSNDGGLENLNKENCGGSYKGELSNRLSTQLSDYYYYSDGNSFRFYNLNNRHKIWTDKGVIFENE